MMNKNFNRKNFQTAQKLWSEGYDYEDIAEIIKCDKSSVRRILRGIFYTIEERRQQKKRKYASNFKAPRDESPHTKTLRCKREELHFTKLNIELAKNIRKLYFTGKNTQVELAQLNKVNQSTICSLLMGKTWKTCKC